MNASLSLDQNAFDSARLLDPPFADDPIVVDIDPLIRAISQGNAVVFVGAGVSQASGLPSWEHLLKVCLAKAEKHSTAPGEWAKTRHSLDEHNYLMVAELLHKGLGPARLGEYLAEAIGTHAQPSRIHRAVGRIPFSLAVTTNYDNLLEHVVHPPPSAVFTWQETVGIFTAINTSKEKFLNNLVSSGEFGHEPLGRDRPSFPIIKSHGDLAKPDTIVLTRSQYRDLAHQNKAFNECMKALLTYRTVLFVGCSLTDPDTLALMDEIRMIHGTTSLHYAIVSNSMVDAHYEAFLRESFNIHTIVYDAGLFQSPADRRKNAHRSASAPLLDPASLDTPTKEYRRKRVSSPDIRKEDPRTTAVFEILKSISGRAALAIHNRANVLTFGHPLFNQLDACKLLLTHVCEVTGTDYGDICMVTGPHSRKLRRVCSYPSPTGQQDPHWHDVPHNSIIGSLFVQRRLTDDYIYIPNVAHADTYLRRYGHLEPCSDPSTPAAAASAAPAPAPGNAAPANAAPAPAEAADDEEEDALSHTADPFPYDPHATHYQPCHRNTRSELACPILADGECVGILNLESTIEDAYTHAHLQVVRSVATEIGAAYNAARRRIDASRGLDACLYPKDSNHDDPPKEKDCGDLHKLISQDPLVAQQRIHFILWERDCVEGIVRPHHCACDDLGDPLSDPGPDAPPGTCSLVSKEKIKNFFYRYSDSALVIACLRERRRLAVRDAALALQRADSRLAPPLLHGRGVETFKITGPVIAHPIRSYGHMAAVLVAWSKLAPAAPPTVPGHETSKAAVEQHIQSCAPVLIATERVHRILDVLANIPAKGITGRTSNTSEVYAYVGSLLQTVKDEALTARAKIVKLLHLLVNPAAAGMEPPFGRIRLWLRQPGLPDYHCVAASHAPGYDHAPVSAILGTPSSKDDIYFRYTQRRAPTDPYARLQYPAIFGNQRDDNASALQKDPDGCWIVGPIVTLQLQLAEEKTTDPSTAEPPLPFNEDKLNPFSETYAMHGFLTVDSHRIPGTATSSTAATPATAAPSAGAPAASSSKISAAVASPASSPGGISVPSASPVSSPASLRPQAAQTQPGEHPDVQNVQGTQAAQNQTPAVKDQIKLDEHEQLLRFQRRIVDLATSLLADLCNPSHPCNAASELHTEAFAARAKRESQT